MSDNPIANGRVVSTREVATAIQKSEPQTRRILGKLERFGSVKRVGQRGGWLPAVAPIIDLYAAAGIPRPNRGAELMGHAPRLARESSEMEQRAARRDRSRQDDSEVMQTPQNVPTANLDEGVIRPCPAQHEQPGGR